MLDQLNENSNKTCWGWNGGKKGVLIIQKIKPGFNILLKTFN